MLGDQIDHLTADHSGRPGRRGQRADQLAANRRIAVRIGIGQHAECRGQQPVAGEHCGRVIELLMAGRAAAAQIAVVHRRQIVVHERIGMHHFDRRRDLQGAAPCHSEEAAAGEHEKRAQALAGCQCGVAHRLINSRLQARRYHQEPLESCIGQPGRLVQRARKRYRIRRATASQSSFAGSAETRHRGR